MAEKSPWVIDVRLANFEQDVVARSAQVPVVIDFWAPWCGPCRQLGPILEKLAVEANGKFVLAKVNTDEEQQLAMAFGIQSIPVVVAFLNGQPVADFMGVRPEAEIRQWLEQLLPTPAQQLIQEGLQLEATDPQGAESKYREALALAPDEEAVRIRLAAVLLQQGRLDESRSLIQHLETRGYLEPEAERIKSELDLRQAAAETGGVEAARKAAEANPTDLTLKIRLADALAAAQQHKKALEICLDLVRDDRGEIGNEAKETMLKIFQMLGPASELTGEYRRKLATALY
jgi:putative thioredoxin